MHWENLIKHVTSSAKIMLSILTASTLCLVLPNYIEQFPAVPEKYRFIVAMIAIASFVMVAISVITWVAKWVAKCAGQWVGKSQKVLFEDNDLNGLEFSILNYLGENLSQDYININNLEVAGKSNLQMHAVRDSLRKKMLIQSDFMRPEFIWITQEGRERLTKELAKRAP